MRRDTIPILERKIKEKDELVILPNDSQIIMEKVK